MAWGGSEGGLNREGWASCGLPYQAALAPAVRASLTMMISPVLKASPGRSPARQKALECAGVDSSGRVAGSGWGSQAAGVVTQHPASLPTAAKGVCWGDGKFNFRNSRKAGVPDHHEGHFFEPS